MWTTFRIEVPQSTQWQVDRVEKFTHQLTASITRGFFLRMVATAKAVAWGVVISPKDKTSLASALHAFYPEAQLLEIRPSAGQDQEKVDTNNNVARWSLELANSFCMPLKDIRELKTIDPLTALVAVLGNLGLRDRELAYYQLNVLPVGENLIKLVQRELKKKFSFSKGDKVVEFTLGVMATAFSGGGYYPLPEKTVEQRMAEKNFQEERQLAQQKVSLHLREVKMDFLICDVSSEVRRKEMVFNLYNSLTSVSRQFQFLTYKDKKTHRLILSPSEIASLWHLPTEQMEGTSGIMWARKQAPLTVDTPHGIVLGTNRFQGETKEVRLAYPDRVGHVNLIGKNGVGKSTLLHNMIHQDIANGKGVGVIDPNSDLVNDILACSIPPERKQDVIIFDVADDYPVGLNLLSRPAWIEPEIVASQALAIIRKLFADQWSATQMEDALYAALLALTYTPGSIVMDIPRLFLDPGFRYQVLAKVRDPVALEYWRTEFEQMSTAKQQQTARPIVTRVRKFYRNPTMRRIICQQDSLNFRQIMDGKKIFLANLGGLADVEAETLGSILISKFQMAAMSRGNIPKERRVPFYLTIDEVQNFITTSLDKVFSEARKFGLSLTVANQFLSQLSGPVLKAVLGNVGATVVMRVGPDDARAVASSLGGRFSVEDLEALDKYTAAVTMQLNGQSLPAFSLATLPPPEKQDDADDFISDLYDQSRKDYGQPKDDIDQDIASRFPSDQPPPSTHEDQKEWPEEDEDNNDDLYDEQPPHYDNDD